VTFVDDYAHLPAEVAATLAAAQSGGFGRVVAVFQPHRFTRTQAVARAFAGAFAGADLVIVTDIYSAGEAPIPGVTGRLVADAARQGRSADSVRYVPTLEEVALVLEGILVPGDLCLTMGAGDLTALPTKFLERRK
jgi:UDP-N-acetylmuramate--alanine ligase